MAKTTITEQPETEHNQDLETFYLPDYGVSVEAKNVADAIKKAEKSKEK